MNAAFFDAVRSSLFGGSLTQGQVDGCEAVIAEGLRRGTHRNDLAYILATDCWETARTMQPTMNPELGPTLEVRARHAG